MAEEQAAHHLLNVLEERGLDVDLDKILLGFEDDTIKAEAAVWVEEYLHDDTLLTKEELELYETLKKRGLLHQYESQGEPTRPILDHEIASAIESLQSSTAAIDEQCRILQAQKDALMKLKALDKPNLEAEHARNDRRRREGQEKARLDIAVDDVSAAITEHLTETHQEVESEKSAIKSYLSERFSSDDQILSRLPGIVPHIVTQPESSRDENSIEQWCKAVVSFRTSEIKTRVNTVYLDSLSTSSSNGHAEESDEELKGRKAALQAEMEELHAEIASVAEMVVEHELRKPLNELKSRKDREVTQARGAWLDYVLSTLDYMGERLETITNRTKDVTDFQLAMAHVSAAASKRMPEAHAVRPTPIRRTTTGNSSAFTPMVKLKPTKTLDLPATLQDALRHAGVPFNQDSVEALQDMLVNAQLDRERKLHDHYISATTLTHEKLAERSSKADRDLRTIVDALYKHTPFRTVRLTSSSVDDQLKAKKQELDVKNCELLDASGNELSLSDPKVSAFISKYGSKQ